MTTLPRIVARSLWRPVTLVLLPFFAFWGILLPFVVAGLGDEEISLHLFAPLISGVATDAYTRALWHMALLIPLFLSALLWMVRGEVLGNSIAWMAPGFRTRYARTELAAWVAIASMVALVHLRMSGVSAATAAFSLAMLVSLIIHRSRRRSGSGKVSAAIAALLAIAVLRPGVLQRVAEWQPLLVALFCASGFIYLYSELPLVAVAREATLKRLGSSGEDTSHEVGGGPTAGVVSRESVAESAVTPGEWNEPLWGAPMRAWIRAARFESSYALLNKKWGIAFLLVWCAAMVAMTGVSTMALVTAIQLRRVGWGFHLNGRYPVRRAHRARMHLLLDGIAVAALLLIGAASVVVGNTVRVLMGLSPVPMDGRKGMIVAGFLFLIIAPIMLWPFRNRVLETWKQDTDAQFAEQLNPKAYGLSLLALLAIMLPAKAVIPVDSIVLFTGLIALAAIFAYWILLRRRILRGDLV